MRSRGNRLLFGVNQIGRNQIDVDIGPNDIALGIIADSGLVQVVGFKSEGRIAENKSLAQHMRREGIIASGFSEREIEDGIGPCFGLNRVRQNNPRILGVSTRTEYLFLSVLHIPTKQCHHTVLHVHAPNIRKRWANIHIRIRQYDEYIGRNLVVYKLQEVRIGETFMNDHLCNLFSPVLPFLTLICFIKKHNAINQWFRHVSTETLQNLCIA